jgi:hypothetical protein
VVVVMTAAWKDRATGAAPYASRGLRGRVKGRTVRMFGFATRVEARRALEHAHRVLERWQVRQRTASKGSDRWRLAPEVRSFAGRVLRLEATGAGDRHWGFEITVPPALGAEGARLAARLVYHALADRGTRYQATSGAEKQSSRQPTMRRSP